MREDAETKESISRSFFYCFLHFLSRSLHSIKNAGQIKDILTTFVGFFIFGDVIFNIMNLLGVGLGLTGGIAYSVMSYIKK